MSMRKPALLFLLATTIGSVGSLGCGGDLIPPPVLSDAALGRIIIYRNGVAYFERYATIDEDTLTIRVPAERVDDFLKSLTILDEETGETMPVSFPTVEPDGGEVTMTIKLPKGKRRLRISYVTESPAWKPTYRIVLDEKGKSATLQAWAVVDNISGEDWNQVKVGVGSTSALSFRYDLHSIRLVERETLSTDVLRADAPPTGGTPYAVATRKVRVFGNLSADELSDLDGKPSDDAEPAAEAVTLSSGVGSGGSARGRAKKPKARGPANQRRHGSRWAQSISNQIRSSGERIRIEGFAQSGDGNLKRASLARANALKDRLVSEGVPVGQIEVIGTGKLNNREAVRVVATDQQSEQSGQQAKSASGDPGAAQDQPLGSAHFVSSVPMTIERDHSAMVSLLNSKTEAERVFFYDPISARGSSKFAFNAVRLKNPSPYTLDSGPFTVYEAGQFLGEGLSEPILPKSTAFIPYALDRSILADPEIGTREEIDRLLTIQRGIVTTETQRIRKTELTLSNRGQRAATVYVRHKVQPGYELRKSTKAKLKIEKLGGAHLLPVTVPAGEAVEVIIEEQTPVMKTVDIRTPQGVSAIALYLKKAKIEPKLKAKLDDIVKTTTQIGNLRERIDVLGQQMQVYRTRVDEINVQLVTLRKVQQAAKLRRHLASKMEEISDKLQQATMEMTDLKGQIMTLRIELQDKLADLTLKPKKKAADEAKKKAGGGA